MSAQCTATSKRTKERCQRPPLKGWSVCYHHGARGGRPKSNGPHGNKARAQHKADLDLLGELAEGLEEVEGQAN